jgi:hypothetical protein
MLPLVDNILRLQEISEYWSREHNRVRTSIEIFDELLTAFWQNKLIVYGLSGRSPIDRLGLLKTTRLRLQHPGFTIVESKEDIPVLATRNFGGSVSIDLTFYIVLPSNESAWTEDILKNAYDALATLSIEDFDDLVKPAFRSLCTTREGLAEYCDSVPYPRPRFWYTDSEKLEPRSFGGRRSVMRQITAEMKRRAALQHLAPRLREEAAALRLWAEENIEEKEQLPKSLSIENAIRQDYNRLKPVASDEHKT